MSRYNKYIFRKIIQARLVLLCLALLWLMPDTFIITLLYVRFCLSNFASYLFTRSMILLSYYIAEFGLIRSTIFCLPTQLSTCCRSFMRMIYYFGGLCAPSMYAVTIMYTSLSLKRLLGLPIIFGCCKPNHFSNSFHYNVSRL